jgi:3-phenylpropionate/cinnamic acid dioxygenase small subunit
MEIQTLLDEREITRALSQFARILDNKRWDDLSVVFAEDLSFDYGSGGEQRGIKALRANMTRFLDICGGTQHLIGSILVDVNGDQAVSRAYVQARHQAVGATGSSVFDTNGEYIDRWERRPEGWRIVRRDAVWSVLLGDPAVIAAGQIE